MNDLTLVILAAGMGSRYGGLKQIEPIGPTGDFILDYSIYDALQAGFSRVILVIRKELLQDFRNGVGKQIESCCDTTYLFQELDDLPSGCSPTIERNKPWGTGHAVWCCRNDIQTPFAVLNADDFYGRGSFHVLANFLQGLSTPSKEYGLVGYRLENTLSEHGTVARAVCQVEPHGYLSQIQERTRIRRWGNSCAYTENGEDWIALPGKTIVSLNFWGFTTTLFADLEECFCGFLQKTGQNLEVAEFFLPNAIGELIKNGSSKVKMIPTDEKWFGITYPQDKATIQAAIRKLHENGIYPPRLFQ